MVISLAECKRQYILRRSETCEGRSAEALVAEKGQLAVNSLKGRQPMEIFQSKSDVLAFLMPKTR